MEDHLLYDVTDGIATVTLNRPDRMNSLTHEMIIDMVGIFDRTDADDSVRAVIFTGSGRAYCAGADLGSGTSPFAHSKSEPGRHRDTGGLFTLRAMASLKPVIAAINGGAVGFGLSMTLPMDFRVVSEDAKLGFVFASRGIVPDGAASWFLPRVVGAPQALDWCLTGRRFTAQEALAAGLVRSVHPAGDVVEAARSIAREIIEGVAPVSAAMTRQLLWQSLGHAQPMTSHRIESEAIDYLGKRADAREGVLAFVEKRKPQWSMQVSHDAPEWFPWAEEEPFNTDR